MGNETPALVCKLCHDTGWVCESERTKPWGGVTVEHGCQCSSCAGDPCPACNATTSEPPRMPPGTRIIADKEGWRH